MNARDIALITFTILAQMSVGAFWVLGVVHYYAARKEGTAEADRMGDRALLAIIPVLALGLLASLIHLGNPLSAYKAVTNIGSSWLSREILFGVLFFVTGTVFAYMQWRKVGPFSLRNIIDWIAALFGLGLVTSMSNVYLLPAQPAWNTWITPISFFVTTLLLGALSMGVAFTWNYNKVRKSNPACAEVQCKLTYTTLRWIAVVSVILLGIELVVIPINLGFLATGSSAAMATVNLMITEYGMLFALRLILVFVGAGVFGMFIYQNTSSAAQIKVLGTLAYSAFVLVLFAEVLGRFLFYMTHVNVGL